MADILDLKVAATKIISESRFHGEAYYLRKILRREYDISLSPDCLRRWMQKLADEGHFTRSKYPHGGTGYRWGIKEASDEAR